MLEGKLDFMLAGADASATAGDLIRLGMGIPHGIFNKSDQTAKVLFWVSPTQKLYDLFWGLHNMKEQKPEDVVAMAADAGFHVVSIDATIVLEQPSLAPYRDDMRKTVATCCGVDVSEVSIKATTTDGLGLIGRGEGAAALAVAVLDAR